MTQKEYELLFKAHYRFLCTVSYQITNNVAASEDIVQTFFSYIWQRRHQLQLRSGFKTYAFTSVRNKSISYIHASRKMELQPAEAMVDAGVDPFAEAEQEQDMNGQVTVLLHAIEQLPEQRRTIFLLSNRDELTYLEIAGKLGISVNTVKTHIRLAYQFLRQHCLWVLLFFF